MTEEDDKFLTDEPLKFLTLLPPRQAESINFSMEKLQKLYESLKCTICLDLMYQPVYLKCSHRFCKQCIEKFIRTYQKKCCPNCRGELSTRRDLRQDLILTTITNYIFGDIKQFRQKVESSCKKARGYQKGFNTIPSQILLNRKDKILPGLQRKNSEIQEQSNQKRQRDGSHQDQLSKQGYKMRKKVSENIENIQKLKIELVKNESNLSQPKKRKEKKQQQVIQINSQSSELCVEIDKKKQYKNKIIQQEKIVINQQQPIKNKDQIKNKVGQKELQPLKVDKVSKKSEKSDKNQQQCSFQGSLSVSKNRKSKIKSVQPVSPLNQRERINTRSRNLIKSTSVVSQNQQNNIQQDINNINQNKLLQKQPQSIQKQQQTLQHDKQALKARNLLTQQFGKSYLLKLLENCQNKYMVRIQLKKLPTNFITPSLKEKNLYISIKSHLSDICRIIADKLNIQTNNFICIYVQKNYHDLINSQTAAQPLQQPLTKFQEISDHKTTILDLNQLVWKSYHGIQRFSMQQMSKFLKQKTIPSKADSFRTIYYSIKRDIILKK